MGAALRVPIVLLAACLALGALAPVAAAQSYPPKDAGADDPVFAAFRQELRRIAAERDLRGLISLSAPDIHLSFGGDSGEEGLRRLSKSTDFWLALQRVLSTATIAQGEEGYVAPYWFAIEHDARFDPFETFFVMGSDVLLRKSADREAEAIGAVSYGFVRRLTPYRPEGEPEYVEVETSAGRKGFIASRLLRSVVDYRIGFTREGGGWRVSFFVAGD